MISKRNFNRIFTYESLFRIYFDYIKKSTSPGIDGINGKVFEKRIALELEIIQRKVLSNNYKFSPYLCLILLKGIDKFPRLIQKATIRDRIVLRIIYNVLNEEYSSSLKRRSLHSQIKDLVNTIKSQRYNYVLRYDVKDFYPTIDHKILLKEIKRRCKINKLIKLVTDAIENPHQFQKQKGMVINNVGIPQGLSISNILSNIYLVNTDKKYESKPDIKYFRFVDDILILCNNKNFESINSEIQKDFESLNLNLHTEDKFVKQDIKDEFDFLGYIFNDQKIGVRDKSLNKIKTSIINLLSSFKYSKKKNLDRLSFQINLRITGCVVNNNKYGWIFYFSQLNDESVLHSLDHFINKQIKRFGLSINTKKFVKVWKEINLNFHNSKYIPNFDLYKKEQKEKILNLYNIRINDKSLDDDFSILISKEIKKLEKDMASLS